jgi:hypothetical protein
VVPAQVSTRLAFLRNPISMVGVALVTASALLFFVLFLLDTFGYLTNPYLGLLTFVTVPAVFVIGLLLVPIGALRARRRGRAAVEWPRLDLNQPRQRQIAGGVVALTLVNLVLLSMAGYGAVHYMESPGFCGEVCHTVMAPQFVAWQDAPHSRLDCVACHVGEGATYLMRSKISGTRQLFAVATGRFERPIPTPVHTLRPARDTCEQCHWPDKYHGDRPREFREYASDEESSEYVTQLIVHVGGGSERMGVADGIHWHMNLANEIEYIATDDRRQVIPWVRLRDRDGNVREYVVDGVTPEELAAGERRRMDCMDCHNRPAHTFFASAETAVDAALAIGRIHRDLPFVRREAVAALREEYPTQAEALEAIAARLREFYRQPEMAGRAEAALVNRAVATTQDLYRRNVFPSMRVAWGTYPNELGHTAFPGCFRCHDDEHRAQDGSVIRMECDLCHSLPE